jgi:hypothetical protein
MLSAAHITSQLTLSTSILLLACGELLAQEGLLLLGDNRDDV